MKIKRNEITNIIYDRLNKQVPKKYIYSSIKVICDAIVDDFVNGNSVKIDNFGSFDPYTFPGHRGFNVWTKEIQYVEPKRSVKLHIHPEFHKKLISKRNKFEHNS